MPSPARAAIATLAGAGILVAALATARAQSAADLSARIVVDGRTNDFTPLEAVFRNTDICPQLAPSESCGTDEERPDDSSVSTLQDVRQMHVTWDASRLYVAADATVNGAALLLLLDFRPGGAGSMSNLLHWRRSLRFGPEFRPDAFLAVPDGVTRPELWLVRGTESLQRVPPDEFEAVASFDAGAPDRALEAAIPWRVLFPDAPLQPNPEPGAPPAPMFSLPESSARSGLRLMAVVVHREDGLSGPDVAPDNSAGMPQDLRQPAELDRVAHVAWDRPASAPYFIDFGVAVQRQSAPRFLPEPPRPPQPGVRLLDLQTWAGTRPSRLLLGVDTPDFRFTFRIAEPVPPRLYVSASILSLRGEHVRDLYLDVPRSAAGSGGAPFGDAAQDRWDGRDALGHAVPGGIYVLRLTAGPSPGSNMARQQRSITVVR